MLQALKHGPTPYWSIETSSTSRRRHEADRTPHSHGISYRGRVLPREASHWCGRGANRRRADVSSVQIRGAVFPRSQRFRLNWQPCAICKPPMRNCRLQSLLAFRFVVTPTDLAPVFDAMLDKASRLGAATFGILLIRDGELFKGAATRNPPPQLQGLVQEPLKKGPQRLFVRAARGDVVEHILDLRAENTRATDNDRY